MQECVDAGVLLFAKLENKLPDLQDVANGFVPVVAAGHGLQMVGALQAGLLTAQAREIAGVLAHAERLVYQMHRTMTDVALANNVDPPQPLSGGR